MSSNQLALKFRRQPGEVAFDRCFLPVAVLSVLNFTIAIIQLRSRSSDPFTAPLPLPIWHVWLLFALGVLLAAFWLRAVLTLGRAWSDPSSRVLRFSASVLLIPFAAAACRLLMAPF